MFSIVVLFIFLVYQHNVVVQGLFLIIFVGVANVFLHTFLLRLYVILCMA